MRILLPFADGCAMITVYTSKKAGIGMILKHARVLNSSTHRFDREAVVIENGRIISFDGDADGEVFDCEGLFVLPGMIDTHIHGFGGEEFAKPEGDFGNAPSILSDDGVTGFAATVRCMPLDEIAACMKNAAAHIGQATGGAKVLGIHCEGPFVSEERRGAMHPPRLTCDVETMQTLLAAANGHLKLMTIAPERENAAAVIAHATANGVACSMGHTDATYAVAEAAVASGARRATHVFNAMRPLSHRETGILGVSLTDDRVHCEMIADFVHLDPATVKLVYRAKGAENITLISDAGRMSGLPNGQYEVGGILRTVKDGLCLDPEGRIAGSCYSMLKGAQNLLSLGIPLEEIAQMASENPAKALGLFDTVGSIDIGKQADLIVCDEKLHIRAVFVDGIQVK